MQLPPFVFIPVGSYGDVHPIVGLAVAMKARGHAVVVCANAYFRSLIERNGLEFVEFGTEQQYLEATNHPDLWHPRKGAKVVLSSVVQRMLRPAYEYLRQRWERGRFTMIASPLCLSARLLHESHGVPLISTQLQPLVFRSSYEKPGLPLPIPEWAPRWWIDFAFRLADVAVLDPLICPTLNKFRNELGLPPVRRVMHRWWNSPDCILGLWPHWFATFQRDWPKQVHLSGFPQYDERDISPLPAGLASFLDAGDAPIAFTPGSAMRQGRAFFESAVGACEKLGRRGVLLTRFTEHLPQTLPSSVMHVSFAPFSQLLPRCSALVHHGGIGTLAQGFAAGIPQLVMPMGHDQPDNALRVQRLGVGDILLPQQFESMAVAQKLRALLDSTRVRSRCEHIKKQCALDDALGKACDIMECYAEETSETHPSG